MKNSEFRKRFLRGDSFKNNSKSNKRKSISILMIFLFIVAGGMPVYFYLVFSGKMFDFDIVKKLFYSPESIVTYRPIVNSKPDQPFTMNFPKRKQKPFKRLFPQNKSKEFIYSWVDENGVKHFSNHLSSNTNNDLVVTKAIPSKSSKRVYPKSSFSSVSNSRETSVIVKNNSILVPVRLGYNGTEISSLLVLDTGASITTLHGDFADEFGVFDYKYSKSRIADGSIVDTKITNFDYIVVGPYRMNNFRVSIMDYEGSSGLSKGLLGINFLKNVGYQIDYHRKVIKWVSK